MRSIGQTMRDPQFKKLIICGYRRYSISGGMNLVE